MENDNQYYDMDHMNREMQEHKNDSGASFVKGLFTGVISSLVVVLLVVGIYKVVNKEEQASPDITVKVEESPAIEFEEDAIINLDLVKKLQKLEKNIDRYFYLERKTTEEMREGIYKGFLNALSDPYSEYYTKQELIDMENSVAGIFYGIGAHVSLDKETSLPKISDVIDDSPALESGIRADDLIYKIDGQMTYGMTLNEAVSYIRGEEGTKVLLTIVREGENDYLEIEVTRRKVESPTVKTEVMEDGIGYIQISEFDEVTPDQFADGLATLRESGMKKMILDLRGNPGGSLYAVVNIAKMMLPEGNIVYTEDKNGKKVEYKCDGDHKLDIPLIVLIDGNSASASEILAGAIQDYGIGTLVGTTSFGKGIVQQIVDFRDGSAIKVTVSSYYTPNGRNIHGIGIEPDVEVKFDSAAYYDSETPVDNQLEKAKEMLKNE